MSRLATLPDAIEIRRYERTSSKFVIVDAPADVDVSSARAIYRAGDEVVVELSFATFRFVMADVDAAIEGCALLKRAAL